MSDLLRPPRTASPEFLATLPRGYGDFQAYYPSQDPEIEQRERQRIKTLGGGDDTQWGFKLHLNPADDQLSQAACALVDLCRYSRPTREAMFEFKIWRGADTEIFDDVPRLVVYPRNGLIANIIRIGNRALPYLASLGIEGSGREPRYNVPLIDGFCYLAQGSGFTKEQHESYRDQFDPEYNYAFTRQSAPGMANIQNVILPSAGTETRSA